VPQPKTPSMSEPTAVTARLDQGGPDTAASTVATWQAVDAALRPILGGRGVAALYWRSLHLAAADHPWLVQDSVAVDPAMDLQTLAAAIGRQSPGEAAAGSRAALDKFHTLLVSLVGTSLTARLLASVPATRADTPKPQDSPR
jgi:hypothetical protein